MKSIFITGHSGFVGTNLLKSLEKKFKITKYSKESPIVINEQIVINLAGKAHDLKNTSDIFGYYQANTYFLIELFDAFLKSDAKIFITISSVKAVADSLDQVLTESYNPNPITHYGISKLLAEKYIKSKEVPFGKRVYILRPCMIHGPGNKGNLNLLYNLVSKRIPWPLGKFENKRSFCTIENLCFIIMEIITNDIIPSGTYNVADDVSISTNELIKIIANQQRKKIYILKLPKVLIRLFAKIGDYINLPINSEMLNKLTETFEVDNSKIKNALNKQLPISSKDGLVKTLNSFKNNA